MAVGSAGEALRLAEASDWKGLQRLVERQPELARVRGEFGMLPLHWACTDGRAPLALLHRLLAAHPAGARARNAAELLPLHIAIRADAHEAWLARLLKAFPGAVRARLPSGETAVELAEALRLDAARLKLLYRAEQELTPELDGDEEDGDDDDDDELEAEDDVADGEPSNKRRPARRSTSSSLSKKTRPSREQQVEGESWPGPLVGASTRLSVATELSDVEIVSSGSSLSEGAVRLSASRDLLVSPSSVSSGGGPFSPPGSPSTPAPASFGPMARRHSMRHGFGARDADEGVRGRSKAQSTTAAISRRPSGSGTSASASTDERLVSTSLGGRHQSLPIIPSFDTGRRNSVGAFVDVDDGLGSPSDDSDVDAPPGYFLYSQPSLHQQQQQQKLRTYQTQPQPGRQRHHSPFAYRRASHGEVTLAPRRGALESPPEWRLDAECAICRATFNMFKHRHHCRNCGQSICRQHSADKKVSMAAKGFATPQRVCISCYALLAQSRSLQRDLALDGLAGDPLLGAVAFQQQHYANAAPGSSGGSTATALRSTAMSTAMSTARRSSLRGSLVNGSSPGNGAPAAASMPLAPAGTATADAGRELALAAQVRELRALADAQQQQLEQLAQSNAQMQHRLLEHEEDKAETTLLITQLMTRVSALELGRGQQEEDDDDSEDDSSR
jgi:hypothetical protein